jgi:SAM-dependent methyltransferase
VREQRLITDFQVVKNPTSGSPSCILCASADTAPLAKVPAALIDECYQKIIGLSVSKELGDVSVLYLVRCNRCDLRFFCPPLSGSGKFYNSLQRKSWYYLDAKPEYDAALRWIKRSDIVLEIGSGKGVFSERLSRETSYTGLELSEEAAAEATANGIDVRLESIEHHAATHKGRYDVICAFQVLEHIPSPRQFVISSIACLRPGGLLIYCVPSDESFVSTQCNAPLNSPPHHVTRWSDRALRNLEMFGVELILLEHEDLADFHKGAFARTLVMNGLNHVLGRKPQMFDFSLTNAILQRVAHTFARSLVEPVLDSSRFVPRGHSVIAVYRVPELQ